MPNRSQRHLRSFSSDGLDSSGWNGNKFEQSTPLPVALTHPAGPSNINGILRDSDTGELVNGTVVTFTSSDSGVITVNASDTTDASGVFTAAVTTVAAGTAHVICTYPNQGAHNEIELQVNVS